MSKHNHEPGHAFKQTSRFIDKQLRVRRGGVQVWQPLTYVTVVFALAALLLSARLEAAWARPLFVATAPPLGTTVNFAVLAGSTATNTGPTIIDGDLGVSPGSAVTGFPPGIVIPPATIHTTDAVALQAQTDLTTAYSMADQLCDSDLTGQDLGGLTLTPGVYCFDTTAQLTGALTLDGLGDPSAVFIFKIGSTLTTASNSSVILSDGASSCNVFWRAVSSATLDTDTAFVGNILALESITLNTGASLSGKALARTGAVTMDTNTISSICTLSPTNTPTTTATHTLVPDTSTPTLTATNTPIPDTSTPTLTATNTPIPDTSTPTLTATNTLVPDTSTPTLTATNTPIPDTSTPTLTATSIATLIAPGRVEIDKVFCPSNDGTRTEFQVFPPQGANLNLLARTNKTATCETRAGIAFTVKNSNGQVVATVQTGTGGIVQFELPAGTYTLIEDVSSASTTFLVESSNLTAIFVHNFESGKVNLTKFFCESGESGTVISVNGVPQPKFQNECKLGNAQFQIDGGLLFEVGDAGNSLFTLAPGWHTIVEVATGARANFTVKVAQTTTIVVYNFPKATPTPIPTQTSTKTPLPPTNTATKTPVPPTKTSTKTPSANTATKTPVPPTKTSTKTPSANTATKTPVPPTKTSTKTPSANTATKTPVPPTKTSTKTPSANTATKTPVPPTKTSTKTPSANTTTKTPVPPTKTSTKTPSANTATKTPVPPTKTSTKTPSANTATKTPVPPTKTSTKTPSANTATKTPVPPTKTSTKTPSANTATKTPVPRTKTPTKTPANTATKTPVPPTKTSTMTPVSTATKTPRPTPTPTVTPAPGEVKLIHFSCASGDIGTSISVNGAPQPKGQNGCLPSTAQFQIDGGPMFELGSTGIRLFPLLSGSHTIVEVATGTQAKFSVTVGKITTIVVYTFPSQVLNGSDLQPSVALTTSYTIFMPLISQ